MPLTVTIVTPQKKVVHKLAVDELVMPAEKGEVTILPGHTPLLTTLGVGMIRTLSGDERINFLVSYGFAEVRDNQVLILGEDIKPASDLDLELSQKAKAEVEQAGMNKVLGEMEYANYLRKLEQAQKEVELAKLFKTQGSATQPQSKKNKK